MKKIFLDTEFTGLHQNTTLISLALVAESGEEFYAEFTDFDTAQVTTWISNNVLSTLFLTEENQIVNNPKIIHVLGNRFEIKESLENWLGQISQDSATIQIWADCYAWDWVLFCELWGGALNIPMQIHFMPMDLAVLFNLFEKDPNKNRFDYVADTIVSANLKQHNALADATVEMICYQNLELKYF